MRFRDILAKAIFPMVLLMVWAWFVYNFCISLEQSECWKIWMVIGVPYGIPYGIHRMCIWLLPKNFDIGGTAGVWVINIILGCLIGEVVVIWHVLRAVYVLLKYLVDLLR